MKTTSSRTRAGQTKPAQTGTAPTSEQSGSGGSPEQSGNQTPKPEPPPAPLRLSQEFTKELGEIMAGKRSPLEDTFWPLEEFNPFTDRKMGVVQNPLTKEIFSFKQRLLEKLAHLRLPRTIGQEKEYKAKVNLLKEQIGTVKQLLWQYIYAELPDLNDGLGGETFHIMSGWVAAKKSNDDPLRGLDMADVFDLPPAFIEHLRKRAAD